MTSLPPVPVSVSLPAVPTRVARTPSQPAVIVIVTVARFDVARPSEAR